MLLGVDYYEVLDYTADRYFTRAIVDSLLAQFGRRQCADR